MAGTPAEQGISLFRSGQAEDAMPLLRQAIEEEPTRADLHMYLGMCWGRRDKWQDALREFEKAADLDGSSADYPFYAGVALMKLGRAREAHSMFHVAVLNNPQHQKAKAAYDQTASAASEITKSGSSAALPGGVAQFDILSLEMDASAANKPASPDLVAGAVADYNAAKADDVKVKKSGCIGGLVSLFLVPWMLWRG